MGNRRLCQQKEPWHHPAAKYMYIYRSLSSVLLQKKRLINKYSYTEIYSENHYILLNIWKRNGKIISLGLSTRQHGDRIVLANMHARIIKGRWIRM